MKAASRRSRPRGALPSSQRQLPQLRAPGQRLTTLRAEMADKAQSSVWTPRRARPWAEAGENMPTLCHLGGWVAGEGRPGNQGGFLAQAKQKQSIGSVRSEPCQCAKCLVPSVVPLGPVSPHCGLAAPQRKPPHCPTRAGDRLPTCWGLTHPASSPHLLCRAPLWSAATPCGYSCSIPIHLDGVDTVLGPAPSLKGGTVVLELQALASETAALEDC